MTDPVAAAWRALRRSALAAGVACRPVEEHATPWWSATFSGHRLALTLVATSGAALDAWLAALPEADLPIRDHFVADCAVDRVEVGAGEVVVAVSLLVLDAS